MVQFGREGVALTLEGLGTRWGWEKTKVWRFFQKQDNIFQLHKLPGSYGCLIFNTRYPGAAPAIPTSEDIMRILDEIRILEQNAHFEGTDNHKINGMIATYSKRVISQNRVAVPLYTRILLCENCRNCSNDCYRYSYSRCLQVEEKRGPPCAAHQNCPTNTLLSANHMTCLC